MVTREDLLKIEDFLRQRSVKDTQFADADPISAADRISIIQDGENKTVGFKTFIDKLSEMELPDFYNVSKCKSKIFLSLQDAVNLVPVHKRKLGLVITYHNEKGNWLIYQFAGNSINQWGTLTCWKNILQEIVEDFIVLPDEEDITGVQVENRTHLKLKNREYDPKEFSGKGTVILRKNLTGTEACAIDDEDHLINWLQQDAINQENTIYYIRYEFDLDGRAISIPKGSVLVFDGGSINNGTVYLQGTAILGAFEIADIGNVSLFGKFKVGQVLSFNEEGRNILKWFDGERWFEILDITHYNELDSYIKSVVNQHNEDISTLNEKYNSAEGRLDTVENDIADLQTDTYSLQTSLNQISNTVNNNSTSITDIYSKIEELKTTLESLDTTIANAIKNYFQNNSITADKTKGTLKFTGAASGSFNGSDDLTIDIPVSEAVEVSKETLTIKQGETTLGTYNGTTAKTITIPETSPSADKVTHKITFKGAATGEFDGSNDLTVTIPTPTVITGLESEIEQLKTKVKTLEDYITKLQNETVTLNLEPGTNAVEVQVGATDVNGENVDVDYDVTHSEGLTVEEQ